jgi:serine phosphatase RsbU (regulator of sigma subunit)
VVKSQVHSLASEIHDPAEVLTALEEELGRIALPGFLSSFLVFDRPDEGEFSWAGAGHPPALLWTPGSEPGGGRHRLLSSEGMLVNTGLPQYPRRSRTHARVAESRILLFTDGYPETVDPSGRHFDAEEEDGPEASEGWHAASPFGRAVRQALRAAAPADGIGLLEGERNRFAGGLPATDDRAAALAFLT